MQKPGMKRHLGTAAKATAGLVSIATAGVTIFTFARSYGLVGAPAPAALTVGNLGVSWIGLAPVADTAIAIGDTVRFAATVTDVNGTALFGATIRWTSDDSTIAQPIGAGRVIARRPGTAVILAIAGHEVARSRVVVRQRVASVHLEHDSAVTLAEDQSRRLAFRAFDGRGNPVVGRRGTWSASDPNIVTMDSAGVALARGQGQTEVSVDVEGVSSRIPMVVVPLPGSIEVASGGTQRAVGGATLAQPVAVKLLSTHGKTIPGAAIRFRTSDGLGRTEPSLVATDSRGIARTSWTLGSLPGRQRLIVTAEGLDSATVVIAEVDPINANTRVVALVDSLHATVNQQIPDTVGIRATDTLGRALADVPVTWTADNRGQVIGLSERTDSLGEAHAVWTLGPAAGLQRARVRLGSGRTVPTFVMRAQAIPVVQVVAAAPVKPAPAKAVSTKASSTKATSTKSMAVTQQGHPTTTTRRTTKRSHNVP
jgi:hypothetical protein